MTDLEIKNALTEFHVLTLTLYGEARGEPIEGKVAVGCVIRNRVATPNRFGHDYRTVCLARAQFSCWWKGGGEANYTVVMDLARRFLADYAITSNAQKDAALEECAYIAQGVMNGKLTDRSRAANHYYSPYAMVPRNRVPDWAKGKEPVANINGHRFYRV